MGWPVFMQTRYFFVNEAQGRRDAKPPPQFFRTKEQNTAAPSLLYATLPLQDKEKSGLRVQDEFK